MSIKQVNQYLTDKSEPLIKSLASLANAIDKRSMGIIAAHIFFILLISASVLNNYLFFDKIVTSAGIVLALLFFASEDQRRKR